MAKTITVPGSSVALYQHPDTYWYPYPFQGRVVQVGTLSGLETAISSAQPNDIIEIVWPGTYNLNNTLVPAAANVHIRGASGVATDIILSGKGMDNASYGGCPHGIYSQYSGLTVSNLTLQQFYFHGVTFGAGATSPTFNNVRFLDIGQQFIKASAFPAAIDNGLVTQCYFAYTAGRPTTNHDGAGYFYGGMIDVHNGAGWQVTMSNFLENAPTEAEINAVTAADPSGTQYWWSPAVYFWNRSSNTLIERNLFLNCGRAVALGLIQRGGGEFDHTGGIIRNNMCTVTSGRLGAAQIADSDGQILAWDSPGTKILHNTILTNNQVADAIQGRWSTNLDIRSNLSDNSIYMRDSASYVGSDNVLTALPSWFVNPTTGNLRLSATGLGAVGTATRLVDCIDDIDGDIRGLNTKIGAHING